MKHIFGAAALILAPAAAGAAPAQPDASVRLADQRAAMAIFDWMDGEWRGDAQIAGPGGTRAVVQTERVGSMLGGTVKIIEGLGRDVDGKTAFNALAVISYDPDSGRYAFRSYAQGHAGTFPVTATSGQFIWEVEAGPRAIIRYIARRENDLWIETGDFLADGQPPRRIFEMTLRRTGDTGWPSAR